VLRFRPVFCVVCVDVVGLVSSCLVMVKRAGLKVYSETPFFKKLCWSQSMTGLTSGSFISKILRVVLSTAAEILIHNDRFYLLVAFMSLTWLYTVHG
jgi:hypothetical protein